MYAIVFAALSGCSDAGMFDMERSNGPVEDGIPAGTLRLDVYPPSTAGGGTLLQQSLIVAPGAYEGIDLGLLPTRTVAGALTAEVVRGWSIGAPASPEPLEATLLALPDSGRLGAAAQSGVDGTFSFAFPAYPGRQSVAIVPLDASIAPVRVVAAPTADRSDWDQDVPTGLPVYGRVVDARSEGIAGVDLRLSMVEGDTVIQSATFQTDSTGWYVARVDDLGEYTLDVVGGAIGTTGLVAPTLSIPVLVEDESGVLVDVPLGNVRDASVNGVVVDSAGERVPDAHLRFTSERLDGGLGSFTVETDASDAGLFITFLLPGTYDVEVIPPYSAAGPRWSGVRLENVRVEDGIDLGQLVLGPPGELAGEVYGAEGAPAERVLVVATELGFAGDVYSGSTDSAGHFAFAVPNVPMLLTLTPSDPEDGAVTHVVVDDPGGVVSFALDPGVLVDGTVTWEGAPVTFGSVEVYDAASGLLLGQAVSDSKGYFSLRVSVPEPPADEDADTDSGGDTGTDTGADTGRDTGTDTGADTGADTGRDTASDTGTDTAR